MAIQLSPGINVSEVDATTATPAVGTTEGAIAGVFRWGPINERVLITSETQLVARFSKPVTKYVDSDRIPVEPSAGGATTWTNSETFYTASNFLQYSDALFVTRVVDATTAKTSAIGGESVTTSFTAKYPGYLGNSLEVSHCKHNSYAAAAVGSSTVSLTPSSTVASFAGFANATEAATIKKGDRIVVGGSELVLAAVAEVQGGTASGSAFDFESDSAPSDANDAGVYAHNATGTGATLALNIQKSSIIQVVNTDTGFNPSLGDPVLYEAKAEDDTAHGVLGGLVDGKTYFAIPVIATVGATLGQLTASATNAYKLALTRQDALNYNHSTNITNVQITAVSSVPVGTSAALNRLSMFTTCTVEGTLASRFTGVAALTNSAYTKQWGDADLFSGNPTANGVHIVVRDLDGEISGTAGTILETYDNVSTSATAKSFDGTSNFIVDVLFNSSNYIKILAASTTLNNVASSSGTSLIGGNDGLDEANIGLGALAAGYDLYKDPADVDVSLILQGRPVGSSGTELANYIIDNVLEVRRDAVGFFSPRLTDDTATEIVTWADGLNASSYAITDSGYKYQYDKYSDVYRYVPLNGDIAGLCARTDDLRDPWFSPAGYSRGNVKNVVKLKFNPNKAQRDLLYKNNVNPVITQPGQGTVLFGDKTKAGITSAFDRINVRRLFLVLEKTVSQAAKSTLFEFNDEFTRAQFVNLVEPFLRDVQGRRGIYDFKVVCDATNNTPQVIDTNQFVGDIYVKPARSINFIQLNFVAVRSGVEFSEIVGQA